MLVYDEATAQASAPDAQAAAQPDTAPASATPTDATPLILLVDDEPGVLSSLRRLLRPTGYRVITAEGGAAPQKCVAARLRSACQSVPKLAL